METRSQLKVSSDRLEKPEIEPATLGLQGKWFIYYTTAVSNICLDMVNVLDKNIDVNFALLYTGKQYSIL